MGTITPEAIEADLRYLQLLSRSFPTIADASTEIINLEAILNLPKGTEHFLTDIHGEYEAFQHVLKNASGAVKRKVNEIFGHTLRESEKKLPTEEIVFKDFENSSAGNEVFYHVRLVPEFFGSGKNVKSKFYINVVQKNQNGEILSSMKVGTPDCQRKGISAYQIDKIFTDASGKSLVFIVQKTLEDDKGTSIRYMVETAVLSTGSAVNDGK